MKRLLSQLWPVMILLTITAGAQGTIWVNDFSDFTGSNATAVSNYTDTDGLNGNSFAVQVDNTLIQPSQAGPWLSQGDVGGDKTAKFLNIADGSTGRGRFKTPIPASMDLTQGISVAWRIRVGAANSGRGPIQITGTVDGSLSSNPFNAYIRLQNSGDPSGNSYIDIQRNGGTLYKDLTGTNDPLRVDRLVLSDNLTDEFHQWSAAIVYNANDNKAYWKLWLDGQLLLFSGPSGSPVLGSEQFSFSTFQEPFTGDPYIGLGDLSNQDAWDFEFSFVNYRDDGAMFFVPEPASVLLLAVGSLLLARRRR